jgi:hypothetical protein
MQIFFDTEFIEDGRTIELISIGMVREDGATYYAEAKECDYSHASPWVKENVLRHLQGSPKPRSNIAAEIVEFAGSKPEFWAYYASYDWVALCQLYGTMMDLPKGWPKLCLDVKQLCIHKGNPKLPPDPVDAHHALADAKWTMEAYRFLSA